MTVSFDLISDLHVETWDSFDWTGQATSPYCVVAGDVARNRDRLLEALEHLSHAPPDPGGGQEHKAREEVAHLQDGAFQRLTPRRNHLQ